MEREREVQVGDERGGGGGVAPANYNYTHTGRHTIPYSIPPSKQQHKEAHKGKQTCPSCCCSSTKGSEKQHGKKARETRVRVAGFFVLCVLHPLPALQLRRLRFIVLSMHRPRYEEDEEPCLILSMKIKLQIDARGDSN